MTRRLRKILGQLRRRLEARYGERLVRLILYGSRARGEPEEGSDIDVLVVLKGPVAPCEEVARTLDDVAGLSLEHDEVIACTFVSEQQYREERSPLLLNVRHEGVAV